MGTLSQHRCRPTLSPLDLRTRTVKQVTDNYLGACKYLAPSERGGSQAHPEDDAISFYYLNAVYAQVGQRVTPDEPLGAYEPLIETYQDVVRASALRLFFYLLLICTRESRHVQHDAALFDELGIVYGAAMEFTKKVRGKASMDAANKLLVDPPNCSLGNYTDHLVAIFSRGPFCSGYGGQKWADTAKVLRNFVHGVFSAELMLDTGFTLAHNGGPIFDKGMLYHKYNSTELIRVLDAQRAGMVPQLVRNKASVFVTARHLTMDATAAAILGPGFGAGAMNWALAKKLGAKGTYAAHPSPHAGFKKAAKEAALKVAYGGAMGVFIDPKMTPVSTPKVRAAS